MKISVEKVSNGYVVSVISRAIIIDPHWIAADGKAVGELIENMPVLLAEYEALALAVKEAAEKKSK